MPDVVVVVVAYNSGPDLQRCLDALGAQTHTGWEAVVWDNASTDGSTDDLRLPPRTRLVRSPDNLGFAAANDRAAALVDSRWVACLNPDAFAAPDWLERLVDAGERTGAAAVASLQLRASDPTVVDGAGDLYGLGGVAARAGYGHPRSRYDLHEAEVFAACGAAALYRRDAWDALGGFDERWFAFFEDVDLGLRLRRAGHRCVLAPDAVVHHVGGGSADKVSGFAEYHGARNAVWTFAKSMPLPLWPAALPLHVLSLVAFLLAGLRRGAAGQRLRGTLDGWRTALPLLRENVRQPHRHLGALLPWLVVDPRVLARRQPVLRSLG